MGEGSWRDGEGRCKWRGGQACGVGEGSWRVKKASESRGEGNWNWGKEGKEQVRVQWREGESGGEGKGGR